MTFSSFLFCQSSPRTLANSSDHEEVFCNTSYQMTFFLHLRQPRLAFCVLAERDTENRPSTPLFSIYFFNRESLKCSHQLTTTIWRKLCRGPAWRTHRYALLSMFLSRLLGGSNRAPRGDGIERQTGKTQILNRLFGGLSRALRGPD